MHLATFLNNATFIHSRFATQYVSTTTHNTSSVLSSISYLLWNKDDFTDSISDKTIDFQVTLFQTMLKKTPVKNKKIKEDLTL